jgi:hypothetical protein
MTAELIPLSVLGLDLPVPVDGWVAELDRRGVAVVEDDLGRLSVPRAVARSLFAEAREQQEAAARKREELERRAVEADQRFRASLPVGIPAGAVPEGISAGELMMMSDPMLGPRRQSVLEHALEHPAGSIVYHPIRDEQVDQ